MHSNLYHPKYRSDIDGLRAIAVLSVVIFHAFPNWVNAGYIGQGGFIGVDIFFVISGFLISTIIFKSLENNTFSFIEFYVKRIKRIFPALIVVLISCFIFGWFTLLPHEYKQLGKHIVGAATYRNNFIFWKESGYFDNISITKPLLHLWSLSIEEQFYIIWPFLVWITYKNKFNLLNILIAITILSFSFHLQKLNIDKVAAFYAPQLRAWELLIGSLVAHLIAYPKPSLKFFALKLDGYICKTFLSKNTLNDGHALQNIQSIFGFILIVIGVTIVSKDISFPGWWAMLLPVLGTALIIGASKEAWVNRNILSNKFLVWFGLISYPLYLWHWPLLSFASIIESDEPTRNIRIALVIISIVLAWLTYELIEKRIRFGSLKTSSTVPLVLIMILLGCLGYAADKKHIFPRSQKNKITQYFNFSAYGKPKGEYLNQKYKFGTLGYNTENKILLLGDSHSEQYRNTLAEAQLKAKKLNQPVPEVMYNIDYLGHSALLEMSKKVLDDNKISIVVFSNFWALNYGSDKINYSVRCCGKGQGGSIGGDSYHAPLSNDQMNIIDNELINASLSLKRSGKRVYFILDNPFGEELSPKGLIKRNFLNGIQISLTPLSKDKAIQRDEPSRSRIISIAQKSGAKVIDPFEYLCNQQECPSLSQDGTPIYKDYDHLSPYAVTQLVHYLDFLFLK
jgi:peptidoglycan/LPS O-acetylase OafA/YrhL